MPHMIAEVLISEYFFLPVHQSQPNYTVCWGTLLLRFLSHNSKPPNRLFHAGAGVNAKVSLHQWHMVFPAGKRDFLFALARIL